MLAMLHHASSSQTHYIQSLQHPFPSILNLFITIYVFPFEPPHKHLQDCSIRFPGAKIIDFACYCI